jgi:hypothetical protein
MRYYHGWLHYDLLHSPGDDTDVMSCYMGMNTYLKQKVILHFKLYRIIIDYV